MADMNNEWKVQLGAELSNKAKDDIRSQLKSIKDLSTTVEKATLGQNIKKHIQNQLDRFRGINIGIESANFSADFARNIQNQLDRMSFNLNFNNGNFPNNGGGRGGNQPPNNPRPNNGNNDIFTNFRTSLQRMGMSQTEIEQVVNQVRVLNVEVQSLNESLSRSTDRRGNLRERLSVNVSGINELGNEVTILQQFDTLTGNLISQTDKVASAAQNTNSQMDNLVAQQTKRMADLRNQVSQVYQSAIDPNASKSITDQSHLQELENRYRQITDEIANMGSTSKTEFERQAAHITSLITELKNLKAQYKNMENISTSLKADKLEEAASKAESQFASLQARIQNAGVDSQKLTDNVTIIQDALNRRASGEILNKTELEAVATALTNARNELTALIDIKATNNALEKVKLDAQSVVNELDEMSKKNPTFDSWEHELNGVKITVADLKQELAGIANASDLSVTRAKVNEFKSAFKATIETAKVSASELKKAQDGLANGTFDAQYKTMEARAASFVNKNGEAIVSVNDLSDALKELKKASDPTKLVDAAKKFSDEYKKADNQIKTLTTSLNRVVTEQQRLSKANTIDSFLSKNTRITAQAKKQLEDYSKALRDVGTAMSRDSFNAIANGFKKIETNMRGLGRLGASLSQQMTEAAESFSQWISISSAIMLVVSNVKNAVSELKEVNTYLTEISKANDKLSKQELAQIGNSSFDVASKYGKSATDYLSGVQEASRAGYENAEAIAELSTAAQGAGDMTADLANQMLIATDKAYKLGGSVESLRKILDGVNYITNHNAVNMTELSEGLSIVGSTAASFGVDINELVAALGTMSATTQQSGSEVARAFRAILLNIRQVSDEEEGIDAEGLTKYEQACNALGVSLKEVKNGVQELRDPMKVLEDLSKAYENLSEGDIRRTNLLNSVGGKMRATQLDALLRQWDTYSKMLQQYEDGIGSMAVEAEKTAQSWEGSLNRLKNTFDDTIGNIADSDAIITIINSLNSLLSVVNDITDATGSMNNVAAILGGIAGSQGLGLTNYVTIHSLRVPFYKIA